MGKYHSSTSAAFLQEAGTLEKLPEMSEDEQLALLVTDGMLVKRYRWWLATDSC